MYDITAMLDRDGVKNNPEFPRLVSYPRTGSHWLRILLESYLGEPSYVQRFFDSNPKSFWGFHIHDRRVGNYEPSEGLTAGLKKVIYLHRDPVDTIYSQLRYDHTIASNWNGERNQWLDDQVQSLVEEYRAHLSRWTRDNSDIESMISLSYEELKSNPVESMAHVLRFLGREVDTTKILAVYEKCNKSLTKSVTPHDPAALSAEAVQAPEVYENTRERFRVAYDSIIREQFAGLR